MSSNTDAGKIEAQLISKLSSVIDPELGCDIVELGMVKAVTLEDQLVTIRLALTTMGCPLRSQISKDIESAVSSFDETLSTKIDWVEMTPEEKSSAMQLARKRNQSEETSRIPRSATIIGVASGKGGVGKSSVSVNLAVALAATGSKVGFIDADIWGFSTPRMFGIDQRLEANKDPEQEKPLITPASKPFGKGRIDLVSMGLLAEDEGSALMWRGLMLNRAVQHFCEDVLWADDLEYLIIDLPPGTGDVAMGIAQMLPRTQILVVTTPSLAAQRVATRAVSMARKSNLRVAGVVENMAYFESEGKRHNIFGSGGGEKLAEEAGVPLIAQIPIEPNVAHGGDDGTPESLSDSAAGDAFRALAHDVAGRLGPAELEGCTARLLQAVEAALD